MKLLKWLFLFVAFPCSAKTINFIVPYGAGGATDFLARTVAERIESQLKINVVIINKPGASGNIGFNAFLECQKNCLLLAGPNIITNKKHIPESYPDKISKIPPIAFVEDTPQILYIRTSLHVLSFLDLQQKTTTLIFGHGGKGSTGHKSFEKICRYFSCQEIVYKSGNAAIVDLLGQRIDAMTIPAYGIDVMSSNKTIPILVLGKNRYKNLDVPTAIEIGKDDLIVESWWMLFERKMGETHKINIQRLFDNKMNFIQRWKHTSE